MITIDPKLAAELLRNLAEEIDSGKTKLMSLDNTYYDALKWGTITIKHGEKNG